MSTQDATPNTQPAAPTRRLKRRLAALPVAAAALAVGALGSNAQPAGAVTVCPAGFVGSAANPYAPNDTFSLVFRHGATNTTGSLQMYIHTTLGTCRHDARAGSGKAGWNENQSNGGPLPLGDYRITSITTASTSTIKGWKAQLTMDGQPAGQARSQAGTQRTDLFLHSEMRATGSFGNSYTTPPAPAMTLPDGSILPFTKQANPAGDQADLWEGDGDYASLGCIKVAPADAAILENLRSHFPYLALNVRLKSV